MSEVTTEERLEETVKEAFNKATDYKKTGKIIALCTAALFSILAIAGLAWKLRKQGKELAKLKHDKNVHDEELRRAAADALIKTHEADKDAAIDRAEAHLAKSQEISAKIDNIILDNQDQKNKIEALANWDMIDEYLKRK